MTMAAGLNLWACSASSSTLLLAVRQYTSYKSACSSITSRACVPIDPVEPRMAICFFCSITTFDEFGCKGTKNPQIHIAFLRKLLSYRGFTIPLWLESLNFHTNGGKEPAALLGDEVGVDAAAVVAGIQEVVDIEGEGDGAKRVFAAEVDDEARGHFFFLV